MNILCKTRLAIIFSMHFANIFSMHNNYNLNVVPKKFRALKKILNDDFYENARINGLVSYIYYPSGEDKQGHSELEIEGNCWSTIFAHDKYESLERKIKRSTTKHQFKPWKMQGRFFKQYLITVSPKQLELLDNYLMKEKEYPTTAHFILWEILAGLTYKTCSYNVLTKLSETCDFCIPMPYKISPFLSELYIKATKPSQIQCEQKYGIRSGFSGEIGEVSMMLMALTLCCTLFTYIINTLLTNI